MALDAEAFGFEAARRTMVDGQVRPSDVTRVNVIDAMLWAPRERFVPKAKRASAYVGEHIEIAPGRWELDPRTFAKMVDAVAPGGDDLALVVGGGLGYAPAVFAQLCAAIVAVESDEALASGGASNLAAVNLDTVISHQGPLEGGCAEHAPYNVIFVNGAIETAPSAELLQQQGEGGRLVCLRRDPRASAALGRCELHVKSGGAVGARWVFDASAPTLPGFEAKTGFEF